MTEVALPAQLRQYGPIECVCMIEEQMIGTNVGIVKMAYTKCSQFSHAAKAFEKCDVTYRPKYSGYYHGSHSSEEEETKKDQCVHYAPHQLHQASGQERAGRQQLHPVPQQAVPLYHGETTVYSDKLKLPASDSLASP